MAQPPGCDALMDVSSQIAMSWTYISVLPYMLYLVGPSELRILEVTIFWEVFHGAPAQWLWCSPILYVSKRTRAPRDGSCFIRRG